jgi:hypothetical protein
MVSLIGAGPVRGIPANPGGIDVAVVQISDGASVQAGAGAAVAELGTVSGNLRPGTAGISIVRRDRSYVVVTFIGLRATSATRAGHVSFQAFLDSPLPGIVIRVDGVELSSAPVVFATGMPLGLVTRHRLEVEIPNSMPVARVPSEIPLQFGAVAH